MNILVNKTIIEIKIAEDRQALLFKTDSGDIKVLVDASCSSCSWIEHIETPALGFPAKVISAEDLEMPDKGDIDGCNCVQYYGFKIVTDKGEIVIDYRNDSNGYYGGKLSFPGDSFYGGVHEQNVSEEVWIDAVDV